jgi:hypothetical protein
MPDSLADQLDLALAWRRVKNDQPERIFIRHPFEIAVIEQDLNGWLSNLGDSIRNDSYNPSSSLVSDVPKGKGAVRPAAHLSMADRVVYAGCVGLCFPQIHRHLAWAQGTIDFAYRFSVNADNPDWLRNQFQGWQDFRTQSLARIDAGSSYVVFADIAAYYEYIDISVLISDLRQIGAPISVLNLLSACLNRWAQVSGRSIPQGHSASDILGKLYLHTIDQNLRAMGICHFRYVDDFRMFCRDRVEAKKAIIELARLLRKRGLSLQSAKLEIRRADDARRNIDGVLPILTNVRRNFIAQVIGSLGLAIPYVSLAEAESILARESDNASIDLIREAYRTFFIDTADSEFNPTLFHFLLNRLGRQRDRFAVEHCLALFEKHPEETQHILRYFRATDAVCEVELVLISFLNSPDALYPYQNFQIIEWFSEIDHTPSEGFIAIIRRLAFDSSQPSYLRSVCRKIIGDYGSTADLERLESDYPEARNSLEQSEIICCLRRMEVGRRNAFLRRAEGDGFLNRNAARLIRGS